MRKGFVELFMGALRPPNPPTAERGGAGFWFMPRHFVPFSFMSDERALVVIFWIG